MQEQLAKALEDRYRIERELGRGGMATVYLAEDFRHGRDVAVKVLHPDLASALGNDRFLREIRLAARLNHPNILPLFDSGEAGGFLYYVMPYIEGESLRERLNRDKQIPLEEGLGIARAVAGALDYAHRNRIVHRDVKPENIMMHEGQPMVMDFGIGKALTAAGADTLTQVGMVVGTPAYVSPEQAAPLFERAASLRPEDYQAPAFLANAYTAQGRVGEAGKASRRAIKAIEKWLDVNPDDARALNLGATIWSNLGESEKALEWGKRSLQIDPEDPQLLYNVGCVFAVEGMKEDALQCLEQAIDKGYGHREWIEHDSDLNSLRSDQRFQALLDRI